MQGQNPMQGSTVVIHYEREGEIHRLALTSTDKHFMDHHGVEIPRFARDLLEPRGGDVFSATRLETLELELI